MSIMQEVNRPTDTVCPPAMSYHLALRDFLKRTDSELWAWFASRRGSFKLADDARFELLKTTYRADRTAHPAVYAAADEVARCLGIAAPLTLYQAQHPDQLNASLVYIPGEVHIVLHGPIADQLTATEFQSVLAHEMAHYQLWEGWQGEFCIAADLLEALITDALAHPAHLASWRLFRMYAEIYCDRTALAVTSDAASVVSALVKVQTGVADIHAAAYLRQAEEVVARGAGGTEGVTHPEAYIRARAVQLWSERGRESEAEIERLIEGRPGLDDLDLLAQEHVAVLTRRVIDSLLSHPWFQTDVVLAHARLFIDDYQPPAAELVDARLADDLRIEPESLRDYYCFLLLDFVSADRDLDELPLALGLTLAEQWRIRDRFRDLVRQELKVRKNQLERIDRNKQSLLANADRSATRA